MFNLEKDDLTQIAQQKFKKVQNVTRIPISNEAERLYFFKQKRCEIRIQAKHPTGNLFNMRKIINAEKQSRSHRFPVIHTPELRGRYI